MPASVLGGPSITVEIGLASNPSTAIGSTTWTDISAHWRDIQIHRGRSTEFDQFQAGTMSITLDNRDRRFDPNYAAGPYFGNLLPMRRIRVRATWNAVTYPLWSGFVDDWPQSYVVSKEATVTLSCTDGFGVLALNKLPESLYADTIPNDSPAIWWRLGEQSGTTATDSSGNSRDGVYIGGATFDSTTGLMAGGNDSAINFDGVDDGVRFTYISPGFWPASPITLECWINVPTSFATAGNYGIISLDDGSLEFFRIILLTTTGPFTFTLQWYATTYLGGGPIIVQNVADLRGQSLHLAMTVDAGLTVTAYLNGVSIGSAVMPTSGPSPNIHVGGTLTVPQPLSGVIDEVAVYNSALSAATLLAHYNAGAAPWNGDNTGARIGHILDEVSWPSADRTLDAGVTVLGSAIFQQQNALAVAQDIERTEQGQLFMGADGTVVFRNRQWRITNTKAVNSQATFGDSGTELRYATIVTDGGAQYIRNRVRAQNQGGALVEAFDATSVTTYYERVDDTCVGILGTSDLQARDLANYRLNQFKNPVQRVTQLTFNPRRDQTNLWPVALGADIGYRYTVNRRPQGVGAALTYTALVEGLDHSFDAQGNWATTLSLSAADATQNYLILDDATYGKLDTARLGF